MVVVRIVENGKVFDTEGLTITYVKQASDLGDITKANSSYSWSFKLPKTENNTEILLGLGMVGDISRRPYQIFHCQIVDNGIEIVAYGLLKIQSTDSEYKAFVQEGIVEFYDAIRTDTIVDAVPLDDLTHLATIDNIVDSQLPDSPYRYVVADYNFIPPDNSGATTSMTQTAMIPSISMSYLFDEIMKTYGWTYEGLPDISNLWLTYPITKGSDDVVLLQIFSATYPTQDVPFQDSSPTPFRLPMANPNVLLDPAYITEIVTDLQWEILNTGTYAFKVDINGYQTVRDGNTGGAEEYNEEIYIIVVINGVQTLQVSSVVNGLTQINTIVNQGDIVEIFCRPFEDSGDGQEPKVFSAICIIELLNVTQTEFITAFLKYKVKDFFKEVMLRTAVTADVDAFTKNIKFQTLDQRLNSTPIDWSEKFVERKSESYVYKSYAQENYFRHQYNEGFEQDYADGVLIVNNLNLPIEKDIYVSKIYAPTEEAQIFKNPQGEYLVRTYPMWVAEPKEEEDPNDPPNKITIIEYKPLKGRFYVIETRPPAQINTGGFLIDTFLMQNFYSAISVGGLYIDVVEREYELIRKVLNDSRIHEIELLLSKADVMSLDISGVYYFEWEKQIYLLNKLTWKEGVTTIGEFIRINF